MCIALVLATNVTFGAERVSLRGPDAHGRWFDVASVHGKLVAITFASRKTEKDARTINDALANHNVFVVSVVDLRDVPKFAHRLAMKEIRTSDRPGKMHHLVDKDGRIAREFGVEPRRHVDVFLVDRRGQMMGHFVGVDELGEAERHIDHAVSRSARRAKR